MGEKKKKKKAVEGGIERGGKQKVVRVANARSAQKRRQLQITTDSPALNNDRELDEYFAIVLEGITRLLIIEGGTH